MNIEFRNNYGFSVIGFVLTSVSYVFVLFLIVLILNGFSIPQIDKQIIIGFLFIYLLSLYIYLGKTNFDFTLSNDEIKITNRLPFFQKTEFIKLKDIHRVLFKHDWNDTYNIQPNRSYFMKQLYNLLRTFIPYDLKWIKVTTDKTRKYNCYGIEFDYWDNEGLLIEDLFLELSEKGICVEWTDDTDKYFKHMNEQAKSNCKKASR